MNKLGLRESDGLDHQVKTFTITEGQIGFGFRETKELPQSWSVDYEKQIDKIFRDEWLISIHRNTGAEVSIATFTVAEKEDKYGNKYYPTDTTLEKNIKDIHKTLESYGQRSYYFKELTKRGATHYHAIIEMGAITQGNIMSMWRYGYSNIKQCRSKFDGIKYVVKKGQWVEGSTLKISD